MIGPRLTNWFTFRRPLITISIVVVGGVLIWRSILVYQASIEFGARQAEIAGGLDALDTKLRDAEVRDRFGWPIASNDESTGGYGSALGPEDGESFSAIAMASSPGTLEAVVSSSREKVDVLPARNDERRGRHRVLDRALDKYGPELLHRYLNSISIVHEIRLAGRNVTGLNVHGYVLVADSFGGVRRTDPEFETVLHEEIVESILESAADKLDVRTWSEVLPTGFAYGRVAGVDARLDSGLSERGFISEYAMTSAIEDFGSIASHLMTGDRDYWQACESSLALRRKRQLVVDFLSRISPKFSLSYFAQLSTK